MSLNLYTAELEKKYISKKKSKYYKKVIPKIIPSMKTLNHNNQTEDDHNNQNNETIVTSLPFIPRKISINKN